ncbi:hypothetical protein BRD18_08230 [Halobacteriales archaeon SW_7_71_33]|nr:MAG: hypothetical protein BRD18_08230 [Halobacteriales archaeon SW_7_71_33]
MTPPTSRRRLLVALGAAAAPTLAGCAGDGSEPDARTTDTRTGTGTGTDTRTPTSTSTSTSTPPATTADDLTARARELTVRLAEGEYAAVSTAFVGEAAEQLTPERLRSAWNQATATRGGFRAIVDTKRETEQGNEVVVVRAEFESGRLDVVWVFSGGRPAGLFLRPPESRSYEPPAYVDRDAFEEVTLALSSPACDLGATLSLPTGGETVPGVVLVHGTGPQDRDLTVGPNKPFRDLAWGLASRGVAVLRYDKRTFACEFSRQDRVTLDDVTTDDAVTALERLAARERVGWTAVVGHSQGGLAAPRIVRRSGAEVSGMALLAAPAGSLWQLVPEQVRHLARLDDEVTDTEAERIERVEAAAERITQGEFDTDERLLGASGRYWASLRSYDQTAVAADLDAHAFVGQGGRDYQVPPSALDAWRETLGDDATYRAYPALDHLLFEGSGPSRPADYRAPNGVARQVVEDLAAWVEAR